MEILTEESLAAAVKKCQENERYHVLVIREYCEDINPLLDYLRQADDTAVTCCHDNTWVKFKNGSYIHIISSNCSARGHKVDLVLCTLNSYLIMRDMAGILQMVEKHNTCFQL